MGFLGTESELIVKTILPSPNNGNPQYLTNPEGRIICPLCPATGKNTSKTRGRFLRRHNAWFCATADYLAYLERKAAAAAASQSKSPQSSEAIVIAEAVKAPVSPSLEVA